MKKALIVFTPQEVAYLRIALAAIFLLPYAVPHLSKITWRQHFFLALVGILGTWLPLLCFATAQQHIDSGIHGVLNSLTPAFVLAIGVVFFHQKMAKNEILGILLSITGAALLMLAETSGFLASFNYYMLLSMLGCLLYGNAINLIKHYLWDLKSTTLVSVSFLFVGAIAILYLWTHPVVFNKINTHPSGYFAFTCVITAGIVNLGIAHIILTQLIKLTSPVFASIESLIAPIVSISWGLLDGEKLLAGHYIGGAIILLGVYFINKPSRKSSQPTLVPKPKEVSVAS
jgi:drug/metabolite transporter (DMT)-like permease